MINNNYYELRFLESYNDDNEFAVFEENSARRTLYDLVSIYDKIILLGNPGIGKTTELKNLFEILWVEKDETNNIPIYINIKNFRKTTKFEELISIPEWKKLPLKFFILDGLDEIADIQDFISEFELFINKNNNLDLKFILSCRTNIFEKYFIHIPNFESVFLKGLQRDQIQRILKNKFDIAVEESLIDNYIVNLENPFNLELFAEFYIKHNHFPSTLSDSWNLFINGEIEIAKEKLVKRFAINKSHILSCLKKIAITNELMQQNFISNDNLYDLLKDDIKIVEEISFIEKIPNSDNYVFRHKNYQEYFAAKYLSELNVDDIIQYIKVPEINKTKPSLFNTLTFLLNILESKKYELIKEWLLTYESEILFFSEKDRLSETLRNEIFEKYFSIYCDDKTFWINSNSKFSSTLLASFANLDFLIEQIDNQENIQRVRLSALEILSHKELPTSRISNIKDFFIKLLENENDYFKSDVLRAIKNCNFHITDQLFLDRILLLTDSITDRDVTHQLIVIISDLKDYSKYIETLLNTIKRHYRLERDNVIRGTEIYVEKILIKTKDYNLFIEVMKVVFNDQYTLSLDKFYGKDIETKIIKKSNDFDNSREFIFKFVDSVLTKKDFYFRNNLIDKIINASTYKEDIIRHLIDTYGISTYNNYLISRYINKENIDYLVNRFIKQELKSDNQTNITSLRNRIFSEKRDLGRYFQEQFIRAGYEFNDLLKTDEEYQKENDDFEIFLQNNFNIIFDREKIIKEIEKYFSDNKLTVVQWKEVHDINWKWYDETGYHGAINTIHELFVHALQNNESVNKEQMIDYINKDHIWLSFIKIILKNGSSQNLKLNDAQIEIIKNLCKSIEANFKYSEVTENDQKYPNNLRTTYNFNILKNLYFFDINYDIHYNQKFYLNTLLYSNLTGFNDNEYYDMIDFIKERVNNDEIFNKQVIKNINDSELSFFNIKNQIYYALENKLALTYEKIGNYILKYSYDSDSILNQYADLISNELEFLKECCRDISSNLCWTAIEIIKNKKLDNDFILQIARKYIKESHSNYLEQAINILFYCNQNDALHTYKIGLDKINEETFGGASGFSIMDVGNYTQLGELNLFEILFKEIFTSSKTSTFYLHYSRTFLQNFVKTLSSFKEGYDKLMIILLKIKFSLDKEDELYFHINILIEICEDSYIVNLSKKKSFQEVSIFLKEN